MEDNLEVAPGQAPPEGTPRLPATAPAEEAARTGSPEDAGEEDDEGSGGSSSPGTIPFFKSDTIIPSSGDVAPCFAFELKREGEESVPHVVFEEAAGGDRRLIFATKRQGNWSTEAIASEAIPSPPPAEPCAFRPAISIDRRGTVYVAYRTGSRLTLAMKQPSGAWDAESDIVGVEIGPDFTIGAEDRISGGGYQLYFRIGRRLAGFSGNASWHSRPQFFGGEPGDRIAIAYDKSSPFPVQRLDRFRRAIASGGGRLWNLDFAAGMDFDIVPDPRLGAQNYAVVPDALTAALHLIEFRKEGSVAERDIGASGQYPSIGATPALQFFISYSHEGKLWVASGQRSGPWSKRVVLNAGDPAVEFRSVIKADGNTLRIVSHNSVRKTLQYLSRSTF